MLTRQTPKYVLPSNQGHLDFGAPSFASDSYVHSPQNARARAALATWRTWPGGVFCLFGEAGAGKSHLGSIWANQAKVPVMADDTFDLNKLAAMPPYEAVIDRADTCDETVLFALLTALEREGGAVLLLARTPPSMWQFTLPDVRSRLNAIACETLTAPEPELLAQLIIRHSAARGFKIDEAASNYLASRIPRTFDATRTIVACMEEVSRSSLKSPMALAQRALQALYQADDLPNETATSDLFDT